MRCVMSSVQSSGSPVPLCINGLTRGVAKHDAKAVLLNLRSAHCSGKNLLAI